MTQLTQTSWDSLQFAVSEEVNSPASHVFAVWRYYSAVTLTMIDVRQRHPKERASHHWLSIHLKDKPTEACFKNSSLSSLEKQKELWWFQSKVGNLHPFISLTKTSLTKPTYVLPSSQKQEEKKKSHGKHLTLQTSKGKYRETDHPFITVRPEWFHRTSTQSGGLCSDVENPEGSRKGAAWLGQGAFYTSLCRSHP